MKPFRPWRSRLCLLGAIVAAYAHPGGVFDAQTVTEVRHWTDRLFSFRVSRPQSLRFRSGEFVMIGLLGDNGKPLLRAYSIASAPFETRAHGYIEFHVGLEIVVTALACLADLAGLRLEAGGKPLPEGVVEQRREHGGGEHQVLAARGQVGGAAQPADVGVAGERAGRGRVSLLVLSRPVTH